MKDLNDVLELYSLWIRNGKAISSRELAYISEGEIVQSGECIGMKKTGADGAYFSDALNIIDYIYMYEISSLQRSVIAVEYGMTQSNVMPKNQKGKALMVGLSIGAYKTQLFRARKKINILMNSPKKEYLKGSRMSVFVL